MSSKTRLFYNRIAIFYPIIGYFLKRHRKLVIDEVNKTLPGDLLEIGVGNGAHLALYTTHKITGIDISERMLNKASRFAKSNIALRVMDGENLLFAESTFDYVVICHVLAVTNDPEQLLRQVFKVLKPGGRLFILNHFTPANWFRYIDIMFQPAAALLHFKSAFFLKQIKALQQFTLIKERSAGIGSYFKILIYAKS